jgi:hypothetical protein
LEVSDLAFFVSEAPALEPRVRDDLGLAFAAAPTGASGFAAAASAGFVETAELVESVDGSALVAFAALREDRPRRGRLGLSVPVLELSAEDDVAASAWF